MDSIDLPSIRQTDRSYRRRDPYWPILIWESRFSCWSVSIYNCKLKKKKLNLATRAPSRHLWTFQTRGELDKNRSLSLSLENLDEQVNHFKHSTQWLILEFNFSIQFKTNSKQFCKLWRERSADECYTRACRVEDTFDEVDEVHWSSWSTCNLRVVSFNLLQVAK